MIEVINAFHKFSLVSGLKPSEAKCEIAGIGVLKGVSLALCGMDCIDLTKKTIKVLGIHFSYNKKLETEENFIRHVWKIEKVLKLWRMRNLTVEGKITIFKTLAISKIIHLSLVTNVPTEIINELNKIQKEFIWNGNNPKIKHSTLCNKYENGGLKNVDILSKVISLQCSWIKRLYDNSSHPWKIIPSHLIDTYLGKNFKFHSNLCIPANKIKRFPIYYKQIFKRWSENLSSSPSLPSAIASQVIWYNKCIKVDNKTLYNFKISRKDINYVGQLFKCDGKPKLWEELKNEFNLQGQLQFIYNQIIHSIPKSWKDALIANLENIKNLVFEGHHLIKNHKIYCLNKLSSKEIYSILIESCDSKSSAQLWYKNIFQNSSLDWKTKYMLPRIVTKDSRLQIFQYKLLNNV